MQESAGRELSLPQQVCNTVPGANQDFFSPSLRLTINSPLVRFFVLLNFRTGLFYALSELIGLLYTPSFY